VGCSGCGGRHGGVIYQRPEVSTLEGIARRLQAMGQRTPRGGLRWSRSSVKNLLDRAREQGLVREGQWA